MPVLSFLAKRGQWRGATRQTPVGEGDGRLARITNGYVSPDGQAIRRWPGWKCVVDFKQGVQVGAWLTEFVASYRSGVAHQVYVDLVRPHCFAQVRGRLLFVGESDFQRQRVLRGGNPVRIVSYNGPAKTLTLDDSSGAEVEHYNSPSGMGVASGTGTPGDYIWIEATGNPALDNKYWRILSIAYNVPTVVTLTTTFSGSGTVGAPNLSTIFRVRAGQVGTASRVNDLDGLSLWTLPALPNVTTPLNGLSPAVLPSVAASRNWDYGPTPNATIGWTEGIAGISRRKCFTPPWRVNPDIAGSRALFGCPGAGVVLQAPLISVPAGNWLPPPDLPNGVYDQIRCLGVPKAALLDPAVKTVANNFLGTAAGQFQALPVGTYKFQVAYKDEGTGEVGLACPEVEYVVAAGEYVNLWVLHPGYLMGETAATSIVVYMTLADDTRVGLWKTFKVQLNGAPPKGVGPLCGTGANLDDLFQRIEVYIPTAYNRNLDETDLDFKRGPDPIAQMPMGSACVRTVRGTTVFAGHVGDSGDDLQTDLGTASVLFEDNDGTQDRHGRGKREMMFRLFDTNAAVSDGGFGIGAGTMPPANAGLEIRSLDDLLFANLKRATIRLGTQINPYAADNLNVVEAPFIYYQRWLVDENAHTVTSFVTGQLIHLVMPRGQYQWSELGKPGVTPAANRDYVDSEPRGDEVEAVGRNGNGAVLATRDQVHVLNWQTNPSGNRPTLVSTQFGCIAANSMVEFDGGVAWISARGPVALRGGALEWIGQDMAPDFTGRNARYRSDSRGRMPHAWAVHDTNRRLVLFGVLRSDTSYAMRQENLLTTTNYLNASDAQRSKFPCDEVLAWSYVTGAWSTWVPPQPIHWMAETVCSDGQVRMCFWAADKRLYALDDAWGAGAEIYGSALGSTPEYASNVFTVAAPLFSEVMGLYYVAPGQEYLIYDPQKRVVGYGTIAAFLTSTTVQLSGTHTWPIGSILVWGWQTLEVATNFESFGDSVERSSLTSVTARYSLHTPATASGAYPYGQQLAESLAWCDVDVVSEDGTKRFDNQYLALDGRVVLEKDRLLQPATLNEIAAGHTTSAGRPRGFNQQVVTRFRGAAQVRLHQIQLEVGE